MRKGSHGSAIIFRQAIHGTRLLQRTIRSGQLRLRPSEIEPDQFPFLHHLQRMRNQTGRQGEILREHGRRSIRRRAHRSLGRGQTFALRVVQRLRENGHQTAHGHRRSRSGRTQFPR